jgi:hypothetical protein
VRVRLRSAQEEFVDEAHLVATSDFENLEVLELRNDVEKQLDSPVSKAGRLRLRQNVGHLALVANNPNACRSTPYRKSCTLRSKRLALSRSLLARPRQACIDWSVANGGPSRPSSRGPIPMGPSIAPIPCHATPNPRPSARLAPIPCQATPTPRPSARLVEPTAHRIRRLATTPTLV